MILCPLDACNITVSQQNIIHIYSQYHIATIRLFIENKVVYSTASKTTSNNNTVELLKLGTWTLFKAINHFSEETNSILSLSNISRGLLYIHLLYKIAI